MAKELYLYSPIYDFVAEFLISQMEENKDQDLVIRANTPGGSVFSGWGIVAKMKEHSGNVLMKIDGSVASMGTFCAVFATEVWALDVSRIHLHRANMYVNGPEDQAFLNGINKDLKAKLIQKINPVKFKEITGFTIEDLFDPEKTIEVWLTGKQGKDVGLVDKVVKLNPTEITAMSDRFKVAAELNASEITQYMERFRIAADKKPEDQKPNPQSTNTVMTTLEELKSKHPELYAQAVAAGKTTGTTEERDRVRGWEAFRNIDAKAVDEGIKGGKMISANDIAEFTAKALSPEALKKLTASNAAAVTTTETTIEKTETQKEVDSLEASVRKSVGLDKTKTAA
jgi:ATP-dependent Clp protease protease subunit